MHAFLSGVSDDAIWFRFFSMANIDWATNWSLDVDYRDRFGLVVETGSPARDHRSCRLRADRSGLRRGGVPGVRRMAGTRHRHRPARSPRRDRRCGGHRDVRRGRPAGQPQDDRRLSRERVRGGRAHDDRRASASSSRHRCRPQAAARFQDRDRLASVAAVAQRSRAASVVVVGASRRPGTVGGAVLANVVAAGFTGRLYAVNEHGGSIHGVERLPLGERDPRARRPRGRGRARRAGGAGGARVRRRRRPRAGGHLRRVRRGRRRRAGPPARAAGGVPGSRHAAGGPQLPRRAQHRAPRFGSTPLSRPHQATPGAIAFLSQSGGLGIAIIEAAARLGVGLSSFVSVGNKADLSSNDFLQYWEQDAATERRAALPRVVRQPAQVRPRGPPRSARPSRSSRSRAGGRPRARAPPRRTPARCSPPPTSPSTRCFARPA